MGGFGTETSGGILLEAGTNEVEIIEFYLAGQSFGVNVAKVKQIIQFKKEFLTKNPHRHKSMAGLFLFRGNAIPLIDLRMAMGYTDGVKGIDECLVLAAEFNGMVTGFLIDGVNRIHRISWSHLEPINSLFEGYCAAFTGSINVEGKEILIIDMEQLVDEITPAAGYSGASAEPAVLSAAGPVKIVLAEDSTYIRNSLCKSLSDSGFKVVSAFDNGQSAYDFIKSSKAAAGAAGKSIAEFVDIVVTDIEMPKMDGLTLCKNIKETLGLRELPVVAFSSLINEQMAVKCRSVGVDMHTTKPKVGELKKLLESRFADGRRA